MHPGTIPSEGQFMTATHPTGFSHIHWSSVRGDWRTPKSLLQELDREFHFTLDPCPSDARADGLKIPWKGTVFVNPPYGRDIGQWVKKGHLDSQLYGATVVMLLPARTDTVWFHNHCHQGEIRFIKGRLHFDEHKNAAPFPSMIVIFRPHARPD
jgi:phage N-6-adenine-methyltransferase